jgi:hypothetical protein
MDQRPVGQAAADHSLFREQGYHTLIRQGATRWADLGHVSGMIEALRANLTGLPSPCPSSIYSVSAIWTRKVMRVHSVAMFLVATT